MTLILIFIIDVLNPTCLRELEPVMEVTSCIQPITSILKIKMNMIICSNRLNCEITWLKLILNIFLPHNEHQGKSQPTIERNRF